MFKIAICDDESFYRNSLNKIVKDYFSSNSNKIVIDQYDNGENFLDFFKKNSHYYHIIFLDIFMDNISGIEVAEKIRSINHDIHIIFLTSSIEHILTGYDVEALYYLIKPIDSQKIYEVLSKSLSKIEILNSSYYTITTQQGIYKLPINTIECFEILNRKIIVYLKDKSTKEFYGKISLLEKYFSNYFFIKVHRSFLVNLEAINAINSSIITLSSGKEIPISRRNIPYVKDQLLNFLNSN